jgi:hypothetical protein
MAATKTSRNDTPNTPDVAESKIARMKVDELRRRLNSRGVKATEELKKPQLVKKLIKAEVAASGRTSPAKKSASASPSSAKKAASPSAKKAASSSSAKKSASSTKKSVSSARKSQNDTPNTPDVAESKIARMKVGELRRELTARGVKGTAEMKKPELVKKLIKAEVAATKKSGAGSRKSAVASASTKKAASAPSKKAVSASTKKAASSSTKKSASNSARKTAGATGAAKKSSSASNGSGGTRTSTATSTR